MIESGFTASPETNQKKPPEIDSPSLSRQPAGPGSLRTGESLFSRRRGLRRRRCLAVCWAQTPVACDQSPTDTPPSSVLRLSWHDWRSLFVFLFRRRGRVRDFGEEPASLLRSGHAEDAYCAAWKVECVLLYRRNSSRL